MLDSALNRKLLRGCADTARTRSHYFGALYRGCCRYWRHFSRWFCEYSHYLDVLYRGYSLRVIILASLVPYVSFITLVNASSTSHVLASSYTRYVDVPEPASLPHKIEIQYPQTLDKISYSTLIYVQCSTQVLPGLRVLAVLNITITPSTQLVGVLGV